MGLGWRGTRTPWSEREGLGLRLLSPNAGEGWERELLGATVGDDWGLAPRSEGGGVWTPGSLALTLLQVPAAPRGLGSVGPGWFLTSLLLFSLCLCPSSQHWVGDRKRQEETRQEERGGGVL